MTDGLAAITYTPIPFINVWLLAAAVIMFAGIFMLNVFIRRQRSQMLQ